MTPNQAPQWAVEEARKLCQSCSRDGLSGCSGCDEIAKVLARVRSQALEQQVRRENKQLKEALKNIRGEFINHGKEKTLHLNCWICEIVDTYLTPILKEVEKQEDKPHE